MAQDISLWGAVYSDVGNILLPKNGGGTAQFDDTSDATAAAADIASGKTAWVNGEKVTGTGSGGGGAPTLKIGAIRPDATLVQSYTYDKWMIADEVLESLPAYTTTDTTLVASEALSTTVTVDYETYNYYVIQRFLTIPSYSVTTKGKGRVEYHVSSRLYEISEVPANRFIALVNGTTKFASRTVTTSDCGVFHRLFYWSGSSAVTVYSSSAYGTFQVVVAPVINSGVMTINSPRFGIRGHTTYFTSTYFNALTDIRYQYVIEVYRAKKGDLNLDGWGHTTQMGHILDCVNTANHKLT